jgi:hypothetical protein
MARPFRSDRSWRFDVGADELWETICETGSYRAWWPWLRRFDEDDGLVAGATWRCVVSPPLPYVVRFEIHHESVEPARRVESVVRGDIGGTAVLTLDDLDDLDGRGCLARLRSDLAPTNPVLRSFGLVARPLVERGHDWVLEVGRRQFVDRAMG